ncbi:hypothetical protein HK105_201242 [Polyrhizophydium stewartii]|uniref:PH domain-containing protein n=1 Tax=Polyrhizophydium stewartii TaxID=2732419 RepID=A0ABR4NHI6_9FUNG
MYAAAKPPPGTTHPRNHTSLGLSSHTLASPYIKPHPVAQPNTGWVLKKAGSGLFAQWRQKYLVLTRDASRSGRVDPAGGLVLFIYDDRDLSKSPKHEILVSDMRVDPAAGGTGVSAAMLRKMAPPFVVYSNKRKFHLAAQTQSDREEWLSVLSGMRTTGAGKRGSAMSRSATAHHLPHGGGHTRASTAGSPLRGSRGGGEPAMLTRTMSRYTSSRIGGGDRGTYAASAIDDDARSVYSAADSEYYDNDDDNDDAVSVASGVSFASSRVDTLSFYSDPVLTPYELTVMGDPSAAATMSAAPSREMHAPQPPIRKRRAPMSLAPADSAGSASGASPSASAAPPPLSWNEKFQMLVSSRAITIEALLQRDVQLMELVGTFRETAAEHAQKMIDEFHVGGEKMLLSTGDGAAGTSGGDGDAKITSELMCTHDGIFYQFACDYDASTPEEIHEALGRSSRELRGVDAALQASCRAGDAQTPVLRTLLMAVIDYKGFRVIAHGDVGAASQLVPLHDLHLAKPALDDAVTTSMALVARELNLKQHAVQINADRRVQVPLSATAQVHLDASTNAMYLTSLHELFPIDHYVEDSAHGRGSVAGHGVRTMALSHPGRLDYGDTQRAINSTHRLRPEFLAAYQTPLCADALTGTSGASRAERDANDADVARACRFLRETWIPAFVRTLDNLDARPFDSQSLAGEMHRNGINMRYLGMIFSLSSIPYVRNLVLVEMLARVAKSLLRDRLRNAILHFRSVGATQIDDQMRAYATSLFCAMLGRGDKTAKFVQEKVAPLMAAKFQFHAVTPKLYDAVHRPALFLAMQAHCGIEFADVMEYDFDTAAPIQQHLHFKRFCPRIKTISGLPQIRSLPRSYGSGGSNSIGGCISLPATPSTSLASSGLATPTSIPPSLASGLSYTGGAASLKEDERLAYLLARHFKSIGPKSKLCPSIASATALAQVAAFYNATSRFEEARLYAQAAVTSAVRNHIVSALASAQLIYALAGLQANAMGAPDPTLLATFRRALTIAEWHWGPEAPLVLCLYDRMSSVYQRAKQPEKALEFTRASLDVAEKALGKNHAYTAAYLTKTGCFHKVLNQIDESIERHTQALHIYQSLRTDASLVAEVHFYMAESLAERGDVDGALQHAQTCRKIRERMFGFSDLRVIESCRQVAGLVMLPFCGYKGVLTPQIKAAYREAIACHEKVFRYLKLVAQQQQQQHQQRRGRDPAMSAASGHAARIMSSASAMSVGTPFSPSSMMSISAAGGKRGSLIRREQAFVAGAGATGSSLAGGVGNSSTDAAASSSPSHAAHLPGLLGASHAGGGLVASPHAQRVTTLLGTAGSPHPISGPLVASPFGWTAPFSRSLLHKLTKEIVTMKLALLESPRHKECVRMLRSQRIAAAAASAAASAASSPTRQGSAATATAAAATAAPSITGDQIDAVMGLDPDEARGVILRLAAVSPSVYLDGILQRIDDEDDSAVEELRVVLMLTESETVGLTPSHV